jgi:hypothetical protein
MTTRSGIGRLALRDPLLKMLFVKKEINVREKTETAEKDNSRSIFPYGREYRKVQSFYRFVE